MSVVSGAYAFAIRGNTLPEGGLESLECVNAKRKIIEHFSDIKGLKLTLENRIFKPISDALYRAVNT